MAVYNIVEIGDEVLREHAKPVLKINDNIIKLLTNMADTLYAADGVGLAAPQIGISKRIIVVDVGEGIMEMINPEIVAREGADTEKEGCLSIPGVAGEVTRARKVTVRGLDRTGQEYTVTGEGLIARAFQHEIDHLDGILFVDKALNVVKK